MAFDARRQGSLALALLTAAISALGTVQTFIEVASGQAFSIQLLAFWIGASSFMVYVGGFVAAMVGGLLFMALEALDPGRELPSGVEAAAYIVGGLIGVLVASLVILQGVVFDYGGMDSFGRGAVAVIGVVVFGGGIWLWRRFTRQPPDPTASVTVQNARLVNGQSYQSAQPHFQHVGQPTYRPPTPPPYVAAPGWFDDGQGAIRWFDGYRWTPHTR